MWLACLFWSTFSDLHSSNCSFSLLTRLIHVCSVILSYAAQSKDGKEKEEYECPTNVGNGNFADPVTCRRFYQVFKCISLIWICSLTHYFFPRVFSVSMGFRTSTVVHLASILTTYKSFARSKMRRAVDPLQQVSQTLHICQDESLFYAQWTHSHHILCTFIFQRHRLWLKRH